VTYRMHKTTVSHVCSRLIGQISICAMMYITYALSEKGATSDLLFGDLPHFVNLHVNGSTTVDARLRICGLIKVL